MRIVYGTDLSLEALAGARLCSWIAQSYEAAGEEVEITIAHVVEPPRRTYGRPSKLADDPDNLRRMERAIRKWLDEHVDEDWNFEVEIREGKSVEELDRLVEELEADYLVLGQTGKGAFARMTLGSTSHSIAQNAPCKVLLAHREFPTFVDIERIFVGVDFDETSRRALAEAADLARHFDAEIHVIHAFNPPVAPTFSGSLIDYSIDEEGALEIQEISEREMEELLDEQAEHLEGLTVRSAVLQGAPTRQLVEYAVNEDADILAVGTVAHGEVDHTLLGSVASGAVRHMPCTMLLVPPADRSKR